MDNLKDMLRQKAEAYQRHMQQAHAQRLMEEVADLAHRLQVKAEDAKVPDAVGPSKGPEPGSEEEPGV